MVQVRRVALLLWATAERELAERPEALNYGLLVLHFLPPPMQEKTLGVHQVLPRGLLGRRRSDCQSCAGHCPPRTRLERPWEPSTAPGVRILKQDLCTDATLGHGRSLHIS